MAESLKKRIRRMDAGQMEAFARELLGYLDRGGSPALERERFREDERDTRHLQKMLEAQRRREAWAGEGAEGGSAWPKADKRYSGEKNEVRRAWAGEDSVPTGGGIRRADGAQSGVCGEKGPEGLYIPAHGGDMKNISDFFRRDSRKYDGGFVRY